VARLDSRSLHSRPQFRQLKILKESSPFLVYLRTKEQSSQMPIMINFDEDLISNEELRLLETKQANLKKLRMKFGEREENKRSTMILSQDAAHPRMLTTQCA
jgi:hypothetical protein